MENDFVINKRLLVDASPDIVWHVLTTPENIEQWLGTEVTSEWEEGASMVFSFTWEGKPYEDRGEILRFEPGHAFSYSYWSAFSGVPDSPENYSKISFLITPKGESVELELRHADFANRTMYEHSEANWEESLQTIKKLSESA